MSFNSVTSAADMRDVVARICEQTIERLRPAYRMGVVESIDREARRCYVVMNGDLAAVPVAMGAVQPLTTGQVVRVDGRQGDRYVADVIGKVYVDNVQASKPPVMVYTRLGTLTCSNNVLTAVPMTSGPLQNDKDGERFINFLGSTFNVMRTGWYEISVSQTWEPDGSGHRFGEMIVNDDSDNRHYFYATPATSSMSTVGSGVVPAFLEEGDTFALRVRQNSGGLLGVSQCKHIIKWLSD